MANRLIFRDQVRRNNNVVKLPYPVSSKRGYPQATLNTSRVEVVLDGVNPTMVLAARPDRKFLQIHNTGANAATYDIGRVADANSFPIPLLATGLDIIRDQSVPLEAIWVFSAILNTRLLIVEEF